MGGVERFAGGLVIDYLDFIVFRNYEINET